MTGALLKTLFLSKSTIQNNVNVIDTDYKSYAVLHECRLDYGFLKKQGMSVFSRQANPIGSKAYLNHRDKVSNIIKSKYGIDETEFAHYADLVNFLKPVV